MDNYTKNITLSGELGSGKSSVASELGRALGFEVISVGAVQRRLAEKHNLDAAAFNKYMETHPELDIECDKMVAELGKGKKRIFDSRLAWHFVKDSYKVYLKVDENIAAKRILGDKKRISERFFALKEAKASIAERRASELLRFKTQYNIMLDNDSNYDLIIHTDKIKPYDTAMLIVFLYINHLTDNYDYPKYYRTVSESFISEAKEYLEINENIS
ncbi:MAG: cytidylate kinase family protein [Tannerellaceae bacterium]|jgi:cytidylate kinase|nr:cytidylate kinase family protein [Tannerellaceae bacterium]